MKKLIFAAAFLFYMVGSAFADGTILDQFYAGFVGNAKLSFESTSRGEQKPEFLDNFVEIGNLKGDHLAAIDSGVGGTLLPASSQLSAAEWSTGIKIHIAPLIKNFVLLPDQWSFLKNLEIDGRGSYNWTYRHPFYGFVFSYPFK